MCTIIIATRVWPDTPLLVAANRDEHLDRPAVGFYRRTVKGVDLFAPQDLEAGGTWLGLNQYGVFVGITNRFGMTKEPHKRSRGRLVETALLAPSAAAAAQWAQTLVGADENGFHLIMADNHGAYLAYHDGLHIQHQVLTPGFHVFTERSLGAGPTQRPEHFYRWAARTPPSPDLAPWAALMATHDADGFEGLCVHLPAHTYGTRACTLLRTGAQTALWHGEGCPCTHPPRPLALPF